MKGASVHNSVNSGSDESLRFAVAESDGKYVSTLRLGGDAPIVLGAFQTREQAARVVDSALQLCGASAVHFPQESAVTTPDWDAGRSALQRALQKKRGAEAELLQGRHKQVKSEEGLGEHEYRSAGRHATWKARNARFLHPAVKQQAIPAGYDAGAQAQASLEVPWMAPTMQAHQQREPQLQPDLKLLHPMHQSALQEHQMLQQQIALEQQRLAQQQQALQQAQLQAQLQLQHPLPPQPLHHMPQLNMVNPEGASAC